MNIIFTPSALQDYQYWAMTDKKTFKKIGILINDISKSNFSGLGKPEALKYKMQGYWSRRIDDENRLIYKIDETNIVIFSCRYHYKK